jgi:hypothetical protein
MTTDIADVRIPDSKLAREATELVRDCESPLLFHHSVRVFLWGTLRGRHRSWNFDPELLYLGAMFHDVGLTEKHRSATDRFELDSANAARTFLRAHGVPENSVELVWDAIALHTTPEIPWHKKPEVALVTAGVELDVMGLGFDEVPDELKAQVLAAHPRRNFKAEIVQAFADGFQHKPESTFGTVNADVLEKMVPGFKRQDFCELISASRFKD